MPLYLGDEHKNNQTMIRI